jgi:hypothetical protein
MQVHDRWLEDVDEKEMKRARRAKRRAERIERERIREEERQSGTAEQDQTSMEMELVTIMLPGETVLETLARLGKDKKKKEAGTGTTKKKRKPHEPVQADPNVMSATAPPLPTSIESQPSPPNFSPRSQKSTQRHMRQYCAPCADLGPFRTIGSLQSQSSNTSGRWREQPRTA